MRRRLRNPGWAACAMACLMSVLAGGASGQESRPAARGIVAGETSFSRHDGPIPSVAFSPDGARLASAGDRVVKVTELATGKEVLSLKASPKMHFFSVAYSPDGKWIAGAQAMLKEQNSTRTGDTTITTLIYFGEVLVWDARTGAVTARLNEEDDPAWAVAFSPDGKWLAVGTGPTPEEKGCRNNCLATGEVALWETGGWKVARRLRGGAAPIRTVAVSPDGRWVAGGASLIDGGRGGSVEEEYKFEVFVWDLPTGELKQKLPAHTNVVTSLAFSPDSRLLASASRDRSWKLWDCRTFQLTKTVSDQMLSLEEMQTIADASGGKSGRGAMPPVSWLNAIRFSSDGQTLIGGAGDGTIRFYERDSARLVGVVKPRGGPMGRPAGSMDDPLERVRVASSGMGELGPIGPRGMRGRGMPMGAPMMQSRWPNHPGFLNSMAVSPDGRVVAIGGFDGKIRLLTLSRRSAE